MVMGTYILFCMISPFIQNKISLEDMDMKEYVETSTSNVNQESMDKRIEQLYIEELEKNITKKVEEQGYKVNKCKVDATIADNVQETKIDKIILDLENGGDTEKENNIEDKIVTGVQKIKDVNTEMKNDINTKKDNSRLTDNQKNELKKFLKEEYEVNEKCLIIN